MNKKLVTVIIPVYNDLSGLKKTIDSLGEQTFSKDKYDVLVANDGGDEAISSFCKNIHIKGIEINPNQGSYHARNTAAKISNTPYLAFIDSGNIADKNWLKNGTKYLEGYDYVAGEVKVLKEKVVDIATFHDYLTDFNIEALFNNLGFGVTGNLFVKKSLFENIGYFDDRLRSCGDLEFGTRARENPHIKNFYAVDCISYHSPRTHKEKIIKMKRIKKGEDLLSEFYKSRFPRLNKSVLSKLKAFLPVRWSSVNNIYQQNERFSKIQLYFYMCKIKMIKAFIDW